MFDCLTNLERLFFKHCCLRKISFMKFFRNIAGKFCFAMFCDTAKRSNFHWKANLQCLTNNVWSLDVGERFLAEKKEGDMTMRQRKNENEEFNISSSFWPALQIHEQQVELFLQIQVSCSFSVSLLCLRLARLDLVSIQKVDQSIKRWILH